MKGLRLTIRVFRLKLLQITSLISKDGFVSSLNLSIPTNAFFEHLTQFVSFWHFLSNTKYPKYIHATWLDYFEVNLTRVVHPKGHCYTFNFPDTNFYNSGMLVLVLSFSLIFHLNLFYSECFKIIFTRKSSVYNPSTATNTSVTNSWIIQSKDRNRLNSDSTETWNKSKRC